VARTLEQLADHRLRLAQRVGVGGIDEVHAVLSRVGGDAARLGPVGLVGEHHRARHNAETLSGLLPSERYCMVRPGRCGGWASEGRDASADRTPDNAIEAASSKHERDEADPHCRRRRRLHRPGPHRSGATEHDLRAQRRRRPVARCTCHADAAGVPLYTSLAELLAGTSPTGDPGHAEPLHVTHALECIAAGVPMLLEKPIAPTVPRPSGWSRLPTPSTPRS